MGGGKFFVYNYFCRNKNKLSNTKLSYMKKLLLTIAAAFLTLGAMAQNVVTEINTENRYTLECRSSYAHSTTRFIGINDNGVINGQSATSAYVTFEEGDEAGRYYIKVGEKYINCDGTNLSASTEKSTAWILGTVGNTVTFNYPGSTKYLNNNGTTCTDGTITGLQANNHPNGPNESNACSTWEMKEYEVSYLTQVTANDLMSRTAPTNIAIKNLSYTNNRWFVGNTGAAPYSAEEFTNDAIFVWEPVQAGVAGSYYLKKGDTYMQTSSPKDFGTIDNAAVFTATAPGVDGTFNGDGDSNLYITGSNDANLVRFVKGSNWINIQNGASGTPVYNTGTGGWTIHYVYEVAEVASFKANISGAGYATFYAPAEVEIPENVKAYYITEGSFNGEKVTLTQIENVIPANTAVILEGAEGEYTFSVSETDAAAVSGNLLKGTVINTNIIGDAYVLGVVEGETGLYKAQMSTVALSSASGSVKVFLNNAYKAYLPASAVPAAANGAANFSFRFGDGTTGVEEVKSENGSVKTIYDLQGRKLERIVAPGIYIVNGKKMLVK